MKKMQIFEPAMCCSTGICGVGVDPELLRISTVLNSLKAKGVVVDRFNLTSAPMEFITNEVVNAYVQKSGAEGLPVTVVDHQIVLTGRYPTNEEFVRLLELPANFIVTRPRTVRANIKRQQSGGCDCSGGNCC